MYRVQRWDTFAISGVASGSCGYRVGGHEGALGLRCGSAILCLVVESVPPPSPLLLVMCMLIVASVGLVTLDRS